MKNHTDTDDYEEPFSEILNIYGGRPFYRIGNDLFFDGDRVHSDFPSLMSVPWSLHTSIRFNLPRYQSEHADNPKKELLERIYKRLNKRMVVTMYILRNFLKVKFRNIQTVL